MATLGSDKLTGIENVDGNDSVVSKRYVESVVPSVGGATKSYLKAEGKSFSTWSIRTLTTSPDSPGERPSYDCDGGFLYSEKDDVLLAAYHYTTNRENYVSASTDAIHWSLRTLPIATSGTKYPVRSLNYANGLYFADASYNLSVSTDTIHWIARTSGTSYSSTPFSGSGSTNIAYGYSETEESYIYYWATYAESITSTDTIHWTTRTKPGGASSTYYNRDSLYNDGYFLTVGGDSTNYMIIASTDAIVWQFRTFGATSVSSSGLYYIQYLDEISKYCALGYNHYGLSTDAIHWEPYDNLNGAVQLTPLVYDNDFKSKKYYTVNRGNNSTYDDLYITTDAIHWTTQDGVLYNSGIDYSTSFYAIHKKPGGGFVRPGDKTLYYTSELEKKSFASETSLQSPKGTALLTFDRYYSDQIRHLYLPSGVTSIFVEWTRGAQCGYTGAPGSSSGSGYRSSPLYKTIIKVDPSNDNLRFSYEVGDTNYSQGANGATFKYLDSNSWKDVGYLVSQQISSNNPYSSALGLTSDGQEAYVLGYNGILASSINGITEWSKRTCAISGAIIAAHAYNGTFFIANASGHTASSTDTIHWTLRTIPSPTNVYEIKDWNNLWRIFYGSGNYAVSTDAIHWTKRTVGVSGFDVYSGAYDSSTGTTILVGGSSRKIASSTDDIHWTRRTVATSYSGSANYTSALSNNNGLFVVAGIYGDTQKSTDGIVWTYIDWMSDLGFSYEGRDDNQSGAYSYYDASEYFNGKFYFSMYDYPSYYGRYASVVSSTDAVHWEHENFGDNHTTFLYDISYSDALKTTLTAFHTNSTNNNALTSWTLYDSTGVLFGTTMDYNNDGLYSYYDLGVESSYNSGELVSGVSGVSDGIDGGTTQYTNVNYAKSIHTGFFTTSGGSGASKVGNGGSVSKKYYGSTQTVSGGSKNLSVFNLTVTNSGSSNYVISGTDETTTHSSASNPTITVKSGNVVIFDVNASGHPFWIKTDESTGTDNRVPTYIVKNNGAETDKVVFNTVGLNAGTYYYNCQYHSSMRGTINVTASTSSFDGSDGTSNAFSGNRFGMGGGGGAAFEQSPNFWTRVGQSEGFPDSNMFGTVSADTYSRFRYDSHYNFWVYSSYDNVNSRFAVSTDVIHWVLRTVGSEGTTGEFATNGSGEYVLQLYSNSGVTASTDTIHWALRTTQYNGSPEGIEYHAGHYFMNMGNRSQASTDTIHWAYRTTGTTDTLQRMAVGNGYIMAVSTQFASAAMSSTDTIHWGRRTVSTRYGYYTYGLGFAGGLFHVSDGQGYGSYNVSTDSIHWVLRTSQARFSEDDAVKYGSYRGTNVYFAQYQGGADYTYSTDTIHWLVSDKISISAAGSTPSGGSAFATDGSGNWYYANRNGDSSDGITNRYRAFYEPGGEEIYATGNGGDGGLGCSGGGGATTAYFGGIGGLGGQGYIQLSWW